MRDDSTSRREDEVRAEAERQGLRLIAASPEQGVSGSGSYQLVDLETDGPVLPDVRGYGLDEIEQYLADPGRFFGATTAE
ncbi:MAG TPA: hypothetical protein VFM07_02035 [Intrasporangium sp.]|nr:hypothetical protein [Intrasporangium sp.]